MSAQPIQKHVVATVNEIPPGSRKMVHLKGREIGIFNVEGNFYAFLNRCPHQGAPVCLGAIDGTHLPSRPNEYCWGREGEILRCPWHGWEFNMTTGQSLFNPRICLKRFTVAIEGTDIIIHL